MTYLRPDERNVIRERVRAMIEGGQTWYAQIARVLAGTRPDIHLNKRIERDAFIVYLRSPWGGGMSETRTVTAYNTLVAECMRKSEPLHFRDRWRYQQFSPGLRQHWSRYVPEPIQRCPQAALMWLEFVSAHRGEQLADAPEEIDARLVRRICQRARGPRRNVASRQTDPERF